MWGTMCGIASKWCDNDAIIMCRREIRLSDVSPMWKSTSYIVSRISFSFSWSEASHDSLIVIESRRIIQRMFELSPPASHSREPVESSGLSICWVNLSSRIIAPTREVKQESIRKSFASGSQTPVRAVHFTSQWNSFVLLEEERKPQEN